MRFWLLLLSLLSLSACKEGAKLWGDKPCSRENVAILRERSDRLQQSSKELNISEDLEWDDGVATLRSSPEAVKNAQLIRDMKESVHQQLVKCGESVPGKNRGEKFIDENMLNHPHQH